MTVKTSDLLPVLGERFTLSLDLYAGARRAMFSSARDGKTVCLAELDGDGLRFTLFFTAREEPLTLAAPGFNGGRADLVYTGNRIALHADGTLTDEEWPLGDPLLYGSVCAVATCGVSLSGEEYNGAKPRTYQSGFSAQGWRPAGFNASAGDCMPFYHDGVFHLFYLFDRRHHRSKWRLGAHQWAHISSADLAHWEEHPMALSIDRQAEGSICTGSVIYHAGEFLAFYTARMSDGSPAQLTRASSDDCVSFKKTGPVLRLHEPYEPVSARDPKVFAGEDGLFHMLVTTSYRKTPSDPFGGALAHLTSPDLERWTEEAPFLTVGTDMRNQPECSDYFRYGDFYYLVYSSGGTRYLVSKQPFGPWSAPENNLLSAGDFVVPKCAATGSGRLIFVGWKPDGGWGGTLNFKEAKAVGADGCLVLGPLPEMC